MLQAALGPCLTEHQICCRCQPVPACTPQQLKLLAQEAARFMPSGCHTEASKSISEPGLMLLRVHIACPDSIPHAARLVRAAAHLV